MAKVREIDELLEDPAGAARSRLREVHPELCFWAWKGRQPLAFAKKKAGGREERLALVDIYFGKSAFHDVRQTHPRSDVADDDILDAFAALWTAERIVSGEAGRLPEHPVCDARGIPMEMVF